MKLNIWEPTFGGLLFNNIILLVGILSYKLKKIINNNSIFKIAIFANILALVIIIVDTQMAGILSRYILDFSWLLFISTSISLLAIFNKINSIDNKGLAKQIYKIFLVLFSISIIFNLLLIPCDFSLGINKYNTLLYYKLSYLYQFWL